MSENEDLSVQIDNHRTLWLTEISRITFEDQALDDLGGDGGVFVVLEDEVEGTFEVLAKATSIWAGEALLALFARSMSKETQNGRSGRSEGAQPEHPEITRVDR